MISIWQKGGVLQEIVLQQEKERLKKKFPERSIEWRNKMIVWWECDAMVTLTTPSGSLPLSVTLPNCYNRFGRPFSDKYEGTFLFAEQLTQK